MELIQQFKNYLLSGKNAASKVTVKNYVADVKKFIAWVENTTRQNFLPQHVSSTTINDYKQAQSHLLSIRSLERQMSSLKKFFEFLKLEGHIGANPFDLLNQKPLSQDPWHLRQFKDFLYVYNASHLTIKNYLIDVKQFFTWAEEVAIANDSYHLAQKNILDKINDNMIEEYRERLLHDGNFSPSSVNRKLSSLRKYLAWAHDQGYLAEAVTALPANVNPSLLNKAVKTPISQELSSNRELFENEIGVAGVEGLPTAHKSLSEAPERALTGGAASEKQVLLGQKPLTGPQENRHEEADTTNTKVRSYSKIPPVRLFQKLLALASLSLEYGVVIPLAHATAHVRHQIWILRGRPLFVAAKKIPSIKIHTPKLEVGFRSNVKNLPKSFYNPLAISIEHFPLHKKVLYHMQYTRPLWYRRYSRLPAARYFNLAILMIFSAMIGFGLYTSFFSNARRNPSLAALPTAPPRVLSFQGRLTDNNDNPITTANTHLRFAIYNSDTATGSALLWQEVDDVNPDTDGDFATLLGNKTTIPQSLFAQNNALWLGVSVETTDELAPRQQIATVAFATNSETLQGLPPITQLGAGTQNVVLALDSSGNLGIAASTTFQSTSGTFTLSGNTVVLNTNTGSNGNVVLAPDGYGVIDLQKPLQNTSNNNNIPSAAGSVEVDDLLSVLATSSGQSAFTINQNGTGPLISASVSGIAKFTVDNAGDVFAAGDITGQTITGVNLHISGNVTSNLIPSITNTYDLGSPSLEWRNIYAQNIIAPSSGGVSGYWQLNSGALAPANITNDVLVGGVATASAKFQVFGLTGNATTAGSLTFSNSGLIQTTSMLPLVLGSNSTGSIQLSANGTTGLYVAASGNVGVGTTNPSQKLDVNGSIQATSLFDLQNNTYFLDPSAATSLRVAGNVGIGGANPTVFTLQSTGHVGPDANNQYDLGSLSQEWRNIYGQHVFANGIEVNQYLQRNNGVISPLNITDDIAVGGISTASAKFQVFGTTGNATTAGTLTFSTSPTIQTTSMQTLTLGGSNTGSVQLSPKGTTGLFVDGTGNVGIGTTNPVGPLEVNGNIYASAFVDRDNTSYLLNPASTSTSLLLAGTEGIGTLTPLTSSGLDIEKNGLGNSVLVVNQSGSGDILTASSSGTTRFTIANDGTIKNNLNPNQNNAYDLGALGLQWNNIYGNNIYSNGVLLTANLWQRTLGVISPTNITDDLAIGGTATSTAKFQIFGLTGNATTAGNLTFAGTSATNVIAARSNAGITIGDTQTGPIKIGTLESGQTLTLGNATGTNVINGSNFAVTSSGNITAATSNTLNGLSVSGSTQTLTANSLSDTGSLTITTGANGNITLTPNGVGTTLINPNAGGQAALIVNKQSTTGDIFTASASGTTRFTIANDGTIKNSLIPNATDTYDLGSSGSLEWRNIYGQHIFASGTELIQYWQRNAGALSPLFISDDLLLGATGTSSAKFAVTNIAGGTPTASLSAGLNSGTYLSADGTLSTKAMQPLTLGTSTTGAINIGSDANFHNIALGNITGATNLTLRVGTGNFSLDGVAGSTYSIGASTTTGTVTIGGTAQTGNLTLGSSSGTNSVLIGNGTGATTVSISNGNTAGAVNVGNAFTTGTITIGGTSQTGNLILGQSTDTNTISIGSAITASSKTQTINIGNGAGAGTAINVNILSGTGTAGVAALSLGNNPQVNVIDLGNVTPAQSRTVTIAGGNTANNDTLNIMGGAPSAGTQTVNILTGNASGGTQAVNIATGTRANTVTIGGAAASTINIGNNLTGGTLALGSSSNTTTIKGTNFTSGGVAYATSNTLNFVTGSSGQCLLSNGSSAPSFGLCTFGNGNYWDLQQGALFPINATLDFLVGATAGASSSAKFAVLNVAAGNPIASVSAGTNTNAMSISADGFLQTARFGDLTVGGTTTGNIILKPKNGTGTITFSGYGTGIIHSNSSGLLTSSAVDLSTSDVTNTLPLNKGGTGLNSYTTGDLVYYNSALSTTQFQKLAIGNNNDMLAIVNGLPTWSPYATHSALFVNNNAQLNTISSATNAIIPTTNGLLNLGDGSHYFGTIYANNILAPVGSGTNGFWQLAANVLAPVSNNYDLIVGGTATGSATPWQVFAQTVGVNTAGTASSSGNLAFRGSSTEIDLLNGTGLTIKASPGGNAGLGSIATLTNAGALTLASNLAVNGSAITTTSTSSFDLLNTTLTGTLNFAGQVGTFNIANNNTNTQFNGNITLGNDVNLKTVNFNSKVASDIYPNASGSYSLGSTLFRWNNLYVNNTFGNAVSGTQGYWQVNNNVISPAFNWQDLGIGGTGTGSAKFQVFAGQFTAGSNSNTSWNGIALSTIPSGTASLSGDLTFTRSGGANVRLLNGGNLAFWSSVGGDGSNAGGLGDSQPWPIMSLVWHSARAGFNPGGGLVVGSTVESNNVTNLNIQNSQNAIHISKSDADSGGYIDTTATNELIVSGGIQIDRSSGLWLPKATCGSSIDISGGFTFYAKCGLTVGSAYNFWNDNKLTLNSAGKLLIGSSGVGNAQLVVNQDNSQGLGDIFSASTAGTPKFTIANDGTIKNNLIPNITDTYSLGSDPSLPGGKEWDTLYVRQVVTPTGNLGSNYWQLSNTNQLAPINASYDLVIGGNSTASAKFQVLGGSVDGGNTRILTSTVTGNALAVGANSLTTGNVASFSGTAITSGNLLNLLAPNPSATFSATSFSGNLINVASANHTYMTLNNTDLTIGGHKNNIVIPTVAKVFVYDTSGDSDGGRWTNDERAQGSSWYNETLNTAYRGSTRPFPRKAIIVVTNNGNPTADLYIFDAKDNSLWMSFSKGSGATNFMIGATSTTTLTSVTALNGKIYLGGSGTGLFIIDFTKDTSNLMVAGGYKAGANTIANRNTATNYFTFNSLPNFSPASVSVNDVAVNIINGQTYIAIATRGSASAGGVTLLNESQEKWVTTFGPVNGLTSNVALTSSGDLYATVCSNANNPCGNFVLKAKHSVQNITSSSSTALYDEVYGYASSTNYGVATTDNNTFASIVFGRGPSASTSANLSIPTANGLYVTQGTSTADGVSNTIYLGENGSDGALAAIQENVASPAAGIIKYYKKNFITDDMVGDIRGFWPLNESSGSVTDASPLGNVLVASSSGVTYGVSGVRGTAVSFNGTTGFLWCSNVNCGGVTDLGVSGASQRLSIGAWVKTSANPAQQVIMSKFNQGVAGTYALSLMSGGFPRFTINGISVNLDASRSVNDGNWHYIVGTYDGSFVKLYIDGQLDGNLAKTGSFSNDGTDFILGAWKVSNSYVNWFNGTIDEPFVSATALSASEVTHNYQVGYRALQNHASQSIRGTTIAADASQQLANSNGNVNAVAASMQNGQIYVGTSNGGISVIGMDTDSVKDIYNSGMTTVDDQANTWSTNNNFVNSISLGQSYGNGILMAFGSNNGGAGKVWMESQDTSLKDWLATNYNPNGATLNQTNINVDGVFRVTNQISTRLDNMAYLATSSASLDLFQIDNNGYVLSQPVKNSTTAFVVNNASGTNDFVIDTVNNQIGVPYLYDLQNSAYFIDLAATGTSMVTAGNVGIGTTTVPHPLTVELTRGASVSIANAAARIGGNDVYTYMGSLSGGSFATWIQAMRVSDSVAFPLALNPNGGNVGISTTSPNTTLGVVGIAHIHDSGQEDNGYPALLRLTRAAATGQYINIIRNGQYPWSIGTVYNANTFAIGTSTATDSNFTSPMFAINTSGNIGIGTTTSSDLVNISGASGNIYIGHSIFDGGYNEIYLNGSTNSGDYNILSKSADKDLYINRPTGQGMHFRMNNSDQMQIFSSGNVGINTSDSYSTKLQVVGSSAFGSISAINTGTQGDGNRMIELWDGNGGNHAFDIGVNESLPRVYFGSLSNGNRLFSVDTGAGTHASSTSNTGADVAEWIHVVDHSIEAGDVVTLDKNYTATQSAALTNTPYDPSLVGIISTKPGVILNDVLIDTNVVPDDFKVLAYTGRVPVKITSKNGSINIADHITSSPISRYGMKATEYGNVVATAMEEFHPTDATCPAVPSINAIVWPVDDGFNPNHPCFKLPDGTYVGKIMALPMVGIYDPNVMLTSTGDFQFLDASPSADFTIPHYYTLADALGTPITRMGSFLELAVGNLRVGNMSAQQIFSNALTIATDKVSINGVSLHDYIVNIVNQVTGGNGSSSTGGPHIYANIISPISLDSDISLDLTNSRISVKNSTTGQTVASIDDAGNASFSGTLASRNFTVSGDATVSGTLHADKIEANSIVGLQAAVGTLSAQNITNVTNIYFASPSAGQNGENSTTGSGGSGNNSSGLLAQNSDFVDIASYSAYFAYVPNLRATTGIFKEGLISLGPTSLTDTSISGTLSIGNYMTFADNSINVVGADLQIQPLKQGGIAFAGDEIHIDSNGNLRVNGNAVFNGNVAVNTLSPTAQDKDINVILGSKSSNQYAPGSNTDDNSQHFRIQNQSGTGVLSVNQFGDLMASGAATISKLNFTSTQQAFAVSATEEVATASAGTSHIGAHQTEMTIDNVHVTANSLIYITPVGQNVVVPYLLRQVAGQSFTVGIQAAQLTPVTFNWLIVN